MSINTAVQNASPKAIEKAFQRVIKNHLPHDRWLGLRNRYRKDTVGKIDSDLPRHPQPPSLKDRQVAEYISVSTLTHCTDGWNYLSRSVESILSGDEMSSIHLAYYAELRAVLSLMATQGIGIFNTKHVWFDGNSDWKRFNGRTHDVTNDLINEWANQENSKDLIFRIIKVNAISIREWITATNYGHLDSILNLLLRDWLRKWSIDLKLKDDSGIRNETSYRPKIFFKNHDPKNTLEKLSTIWKACEPANTSSFQLLDSHLLRIVLDEIYRHYLTQPRSTQPKSMSEFIEDTIRSCGLSSSGSLHQFLANTSPREDHLIINEAQKEIRINDQYGCTFDCFPIICRALLLLRLATGATEMFLKKSTITKNLTAFWWQSIGLNLGLWEDSNEPDDFKDLYQDIREAIDDINFVEPAPWNSLKTANDHYAYEFIKLKQFQRVGLWGIGL